MDKKRQIEMILDKSRQQFLAEIKARLDKALNNLMKSCLAGNEEEYIELRRFFHTVAGTAGTLQLKALANIGVYCESNANSKKFETLKVGDYFTLLAGLAKIDHEIRILTDKYLQISIENMKEDACNSDYTTLSSMASILIVDDDVALLNLLDRIFRLEGYYVVITPKPEDVLDIISKKNFDLVILDIMMPGMDGFELLKRLKSEAPELPVVFLTAKGLKGDKVKALKSGVDDYIVKPFETEEMLARIESIILKTSRNKKYTLTDTLTGAYTKKFFNDDFKEFKARFVRKNEIFSLAFIDMDQFKEINDTHGHLVGDMVLKDFVKYLRECLRITDHIFRFGGDEFLALLPDTNAQLAYSVIERIRESLACVGFMYEGMQQPIKLSFSSGIADYCSKAETPERMLDRADRALYKSKRTGRNRTSIFEEGTVGRVENRKKVFILDDNDVIIRLIKSILMPLDYEVEHAGDGEQALKMLGAFNPDIIISDISLPGISGIETCRQARKIIENKDVKIIVLSSLKDKRTMDACSELGIDQYMGKPFSLAELERAIQRLLGE